MPSEAGYDQRVAPRAAAAMPLARAEGYGAGIGSALGQSGDQMHADQLRSYQLDRRERASHEAADFAHRFALHRQNMDDIVLEKRSNAAPGAAGHTQDIGKANEAAKDSLLAGITDDAVRQQAVEQWTEYSARLHGSEASFETAHRTAKSVTDIAALTDIGANRVRRAPDAKTYAEEVKLGYAAIDAMPGLDADTREKAKRELIDQKYGIAFINHLNDTNPQLAKAMLDAGHFDDKLDPQQIDQLRNGADVEIRRGEAAVEHAAAAEKGQITEAAQTLKARASNGEDVSAEAAQLIPRLAAMGDTSGAVELQGLVQDSAFAQVYEGQPPLQREAALTRLGGIALSQRTSVQQAEIKWLQDHRGPLDSQFNSDPAGWAILHAPAGTKPPPLTTWSAEEIAARAQWQRGASQTYGSMNAISANEAHALAARKQAGTAGYSEVMDTVALFPWWMARDVANMVDPADKAFQAAMSLDQPMRKRLIDGHAAIKANAAIIKPEADQDTAAIARANQGLQQALRFLPAADRAAYIDNANAIAASFLVRGGTMTKELWGQSLHFALGGRGAGPTRTGGLGLWNDTQQGYFLVPDGYTQQRFTDQVFALIRQHPDKGPVNPDGTPANLRNAVPVAARPGVYRFHVGEHEVLGRGRDGKITSPWEFHVGGAR